jgi:excisionase family DNA binding protein
MTRRIQQTADTGARATPLEILTPEEVAARLRIDPTTVYELTRQRCRHPLPVHKIGKVLRFDWAEVQAWFADREKGAA